MNDPTLPSVWTAAGVLLGFQMTNIVWRVNREREMEKAGERLWLPLADWLNLLSMMCNAVGVFMLPALGLVSSIFITRIFGLSLIFLVGYVFAIIGHYRLYRHFGPRPRVPLQEGIPLLVTLAAAGVYVWWWIRASTPS